MKPIRRFTARPWEIVAWPRVIPEDSAWQTREPSYAKTREGHPVKLFPAYAA